MYPVSTLYSFCLPLSATKIYQIQNPSSKEGEKVDLVPWCNTFAGQGRNIHGTYEDYSFMSRQIFLSGCVCHHSCVVCIQQ